MRFTQRIVPGLVAGSLVLGATSGALAAKATTAKAKRLAVVAGQVSNLSSTGFTLTTTPKKSAAGATAPAPKSFSVMVAATTKQVARKGTTGALANGEFAVVVGHRTSTSVAATRVVYSTTAFPAKAIAARVADANARKAARVAAKKLKAARVHRAAGTVAAGTTATNLVITNKAGKTLTFTITSATKFRVAKQIVTTPPLLSAGQSVGVRYARDKTAKTALIARLVTVRATS